jgi:hypothetical protein
VKAGSRAVAHARVGKRERRLIPVGIRERLERGVRRNQAHAARRHPPAAATRPNWPARDQTFNPLVLFLHLIGHGGRRSTRLIRSRRTAPRGRADLSGDSDQGRLAPTGRVYPFEGEPSGEAALLISMVPVRGFVKGWSLPFSGIAA